MTTESHDLKTLESTLLDIRYDGLFSYGERSKVDSVWDDGAQETALQTLLQNTEANPRARFLAAEILFEKSNHPPTLEEIPSLGKVYVKALEDIGQTVPVYHISANHWGFLYEDEDAGRLGGRFLEMGKTVTPDLIALLEVEDIPPYEGSKEAMVGNGYQYRIKDFAAYYLARLHDYPLAYHAAMKERDTAIAAMMKKLD